VGGRPASPRAVGRAPSEGERRPDRDEVQAVGVGDVEELELAADGEALEPDLGADPVDHVGAAVGVELADLADGRPDVGVPADEPGQPNLQVLGVTHDYYVYPDQTCSVRFFAAVHNAGSATAWNFAVGMRSNGVGWIQPTIGTPCSGYWNAIGTVPFIRPGDTKVVLVYGPGYVGPNVLKGTPMNLTAYADNYCAIGESNENDNSLDVNITIGQ